jgi:ubiquinone/menaquinone biosynthesis C-methylase UbiE
MKTRESGMPPEEMWQAFFDSEQVLTKLGLQAKHTCVVDFGCGFGTFSIPAARIVQGIVHAIDIDPEMISATRTKVEELGIRNLRVSQRDFVEQGCGLPDGFADYVLLFNILHAAEAGALLTEARRVLGCRGTLAVMHWNHDPRTPRGPSMDIRLKPEQCLAIVERVGFAVSPLIDLPPHHFGFTAQIA